MIIDFILVDKYTIANASLLQVSSQQIGYVEDVLESYKESLQYPFWKPVIVVVNQIHIGFAMYGLFEEDGEEEQLWLDRFFIDYRYQGQGYAKKVMVRLLEKMRSEYGNLPIYLSVYKENIVAIKLYQSLGFIFTKQLDINGELIMILEIK